MTVAMRLAYNGVVPQKEWNHNPMLKNIASNMTTAMYIAYYCKEVPNKHWNHDPDL